MVHMPGLHAQLLALLQGIETTSFPVSPGGGKMRDTGNEVGVEKSILFSWQSDESIAR